LVDDAELGRGEGQPLRGRTIDLRPRAASIDPARAVPGDHAAVELAPEHLADRGRRPARTQAPSAPRRWDGLRVQELGDPYEAVALRRQLEDPAKDGGLPLVDLAKKL